MGTKIAIFLFCLTIGISINVCAQNVGINSTGAAPAASAGLDVSFTDKGFLTPRMTLAQKNAIAGPATGLLVYQTDGLAGFYYYSGSAWVLFNSGAISGWSTTGNASTTAGTNFLGTTDSKDLVFKTNNAEQARILSGGNFGIGTATPSQKLDVSGNAIFGSGATGKIKLSNTDDAGNNSSDIYIDDDKMLRISNSGLGQTGSSLQLKNSSEKYLFSFEGRGGFRYYSRTPGNIGEKMRVNDEGDIYLTTTDENTAVDGKGNIDDFYQINVQNLNSGSSASSDIVATNNTADGLDYIDMGINSTGYDNSVNGVSTILNGAAATYLYGNGKKMVIGNSGRLQPLIFFTNSSNADGGEDARGSERMRINSSGDVIINGPSNGLNIGGANTNIDDDYDQGNYALQVNGVLRYTSSSQGSDRRIKKNIEPLNYGLKDLMSLNPVKYNWKDTSRSSEKQIGLIAQDVRLVVPEIVTGDESKDILGIEYTALIPVLINAIKELKEEINKQGQEIDALKAMNQKSSGTLK